MAAISSHHNRIPELLRHIQQAPGPIFSLSCETGLPRVTLRRIIRGEVCPDFESVARITDVLERRLGIRLDPRDVVAYNGEFLTPNLDDLLKPPEDEVAEKDCSHGSRLPAV